VGRHAASGSDGVDWSDAPVAAGRRRTDGPDALWSGSPAALSDQATDIGRLRTDRRRDSVLDSALDAGRRPGARRVAGPPAPSGTLDSVRQMSRSRLPLPPVPSGPRTTMAPFQAVPSPEIPAPAVAADVLAPAPAPAGAPVERRRSRAAAVPVAEPAAVPAAGRPGRSWRADGPEHKVVVSDVPTKGARGSVPAPRLGGQSTPAGAPSPAYGDWTKPSRADLAEMAAADEADYLSGPIAAARLQRAPHTSAIPERSVGGRRGRFDDGADEARHEGHDLDDHGFDGHDLDDEPVPAAASAAGAARRGPVSGPTTGSRAARRAELQAADQARKEAAKRNGTPIISPLDEEKPPRRSRVLMGLVAMVVVALGVLGVYQVIAPNTDEAASQASPDTTTSAEVPSVSALPTLPTAPVVVPEAPVDPNLKLPVTVLNATQTTGLAAKISAVIKGGGWDTPPVAQYPGSDVAATTVFFTKGDETQRQAAVNLVNQFPQVVGGPTPRFFEVPAGVAAPGLIVVTTGDWVP
jgi:hypothetical protein